MEIITSRKCNIHCHQVVEICRVILWFFFSHMASLINCGCFYERNFWSFYSLTNILKAAFMQFATECRYFSIEKLIFACDQLKIIGKCDWIVGLKRLLKLIIGLQQNFPLLISTLVELFNEFSILKLLLCNWIWFSILWLNFIGNFWFYCCMFLEIFILSCF